MKIIGILSAYDESASWLSTVVAGLGRFADALVYADGGYALYPGARPRSMPEQAEAVISACEAADLELILHRPKDIYWGNEVEKRNRTLALAGTIAEANKDWVCIFDADMHLMKCNPEVVRWELEHSKHDVATMTVLEGKDFLADSDGLAETAQVIDIDHEWTYKTRLLYRWDPSLTYGPAHWCVSRKRGGKRKWLWGPAEVNLAPTTDLLAGLVVYHRPGERTMLRRLAAEAYYKAREARQIEHLPVP